ncbi:WXG100 family type VII secretion target [Streptomyces bungoensis]|uniref:WXG100 family type VII secretion target n=1 Tax=Streptomyces bungoensis TaxID=285568 RepID=UPI0033DF1C81
MSDDWQKQPQYKSDVQQVDKTVDTQVKPITAAQDMLANMPFFGGFRINLVGSTNFEDHRLNDMIDLVEHANPEHLELTSKALFDAGKDIRKAATELEQHLKVDWEGQGADSFHGWTQQLLQYTHHLAGYADQAGTHLSVAATGLASARISMPPRDTRPAAEQKKPTELPKAKQVDDNPDYVAAVKVEKNRQEAINQMNRLASYYKVAATDLGKQKEPEPLKPITDVGVPKPQGARDDGLAGYGPGAPSAPTAAVGGGSGAGHHSTAEPIGTSTGGHVGPVKEVHQPVTGHGHDVGTEINTVGTLPPTPAPHDTPAPTLPTTGGGSGNMPPLPPGPVTPPVGPTVGRSTGYGPAARLPLSPQGRTGPSGTSSGRLPQGAGRVPQEPEGQTGRTTAGGRVQQGPLGQAARAVGRATPTGQPGMTGATQSGRSPLGRGVTGGTPRPLNTSNGRTEAIDPNSPVRNGVVGGKPVAGRSTSGGPNPRMPRGTVVGAETPVSSSPVKGAVGRRGVVGAPAAEAERGDAHEVLRSAANPEGVIGAPRAAASPSKNSAGRGGDSGNGRGVVGDRRGLESGSGLAGESTEKEHRRRAQKQRRDVSNKSD